MSSCPHTGLSVPECSCKHCIERQLSEFAPARLSLRRVIHDPLLLREVRSVRTLPTAAERLSRPML